MGIDFLDYCRMTCVACRLLAFTLKGDVQRLMRIGMTAHTVLQLKVRLIRMTPRTLRNERTLYRSRRMLSVMAIHAGYFGLMFVAGLRHLLHNCRMTLDTVVGIEFGCFAEGGTRRLNAADEQ